MFMLTFDAATPQPSPANTNYQSYNQSQDPGAQKVLLLSATVAGTGNETGTSE